MPLKPAREARTAAALAQRRCGWDGRAAAAMQLPRPLPPRGRPPQPHTTVCWRAPSTGAAGVLPTLGPLSTGGASSPAPGSSHRTWQRVGRGSVLRVRVVYHNWRACIAARAASVQLEAGCWGLVLGAASQCNWLLLQGALPLCAGGTLPPCLCSMPALACAAPAAPLPVAARPPAAGRWHMRVAATLLHAPCYRRVSNCHKALPGLPRGHR